MRVGLPPTSKSRAKAQARRPRRSPTVAEAAAWADVIMILAPDTSAGRGLQARHRAATSAPGKTLMFAHGFNIRFGTIAPPKDVDVTMVAPEGARPSRARASSSKAAARPALLAVHQDATGNAHALALSYAKGIGVHPRRRASRRRSPRRPRPICSASRPCCAAA